MEKKIRVKLVGRDAHTAYIALPGNRNEPGIVARSIGLADLLDYTGPRVQLDLDQEGRLIGIEILAALSEGTQNAKR